MARTLLDIVQGILEKIDSDEVSSISDTSESLQVAGLVRQVFYDIVEEYDVPSFRKLDSLESVSDVLKPTHLRLPDNVREIHWWKYNVKESPSDPDSYRQMTYLTPEAFVELCNARDSTDSTNHQVVAITNNVDLVIHKLQAPMYWTTFDQEYVVCDAFDSDIDSTLQESKTQAYLEYGPTFTLSDSFEPPLPENLMNLLYRTAENEAFTVYKQAVNPKLEQNERRMRIRAQRNKYRNSLEQNSFGGYPDYGRRR